MWMGTGSERKKQSRARFIQAHRRQRSRLGRRLSRDMTFGWGLVTQSLFDNRIEQRVKGEEGGAGE
jgi:hypothetical protein